jgi:SAM-dependent methyltransferase
MWQEYFPNAKLYGVDISDFSAFETDRFKFVRADAGDEKQLQKVVDLAVPFDVIIDDGSHAPFHQQRAFLSLFPALRPGGLFIIEDIQWQPDTYSHALPCVPRTDRLLTQFVATGRFSETGALPLADWKALERDIKSVFLIDEDWLTVHRRQYNGRYGLKPDQLSFADAGGAFGLLSPRFWRKIVGRLRGDLEGPDGLNRRPRVKLAIIQKA